MVSRKLVGPVEIGLIVGIFLTAIGGVVYAGLSGIVGIPGIPALLAESVEPDPSPSDLAGAINPSPDAAPAASPTAEASTVATPAAEPSTAAATPAASTAPDPKMENDKKRKSDLATIQAALNEYKKKKKSFPTSASYSEGRTDSEGSPLTVLVADGFTSTLPTDPSAPNRFYGYKSDGTSYELTAALENINDPEGKYEGELYLYKVSGS